MAPHLDVEKNQTSGPRFERKRSKQEKGENDDGIFFLCVCVLKMFLQTLTPLGKAEM